MTRLDLTRPAGPASWQPHRPPPASAGGGGLRARAAWPGWEGCSRAAACRHGLRDSDALREMHSVMHFKQCATQGIQGIAGAGMPALAA